MILQLEHSSGREDTVGIPEPMGILDGHGDVPVSPVPWKLSWNSPERKLASQTSLISELQVQLNDPASINEVRIEQGKYQISNLGFYMHVPTCVLIDTIIYVHPW